MKKMKIIALLAALIAGLAIFQLLSEISKPQEVPRTNVVVAAVNIQENTTITADMVMLAPIATESLLKNCVKNLDSVIGMVISSDVIQGEQIVTDRLVRIGDTQSTSNTLAYVVKPGMRAITISVGDTSGLSNMLRPGNFVDVVLNYTYEDDSQSETQEGEAKNVVASKILIQNIEVLAISSSLSKTSIPEEGYTSVTLMVTPEQAVQLSYSEYNASLRLILRSPLDSNKTENSEITIDDIKGEGVD